MKLNKIIIIGMAAITALTMAGCGGGNQPAETPPPPVAMVDATPEPAITAEPSVSVAGGK